MYGTVLAAGVIISLIFTELTGLSAGLIIPGYIALNYENSIKIMTTVVIALLGWLTVRGLSELVILYGRRRFALCIIATFFYQLILKSILPFDISVIGIIVPGLIARNFDSQGFFYTVLSVGVTSLFTLGFILFLI